MSILVTKFYYFSFISYTISKGVQVFKIFSRNLPQLSFNTREFQVAHHSEPCEIQQCRIMADTAAVKL